MQPTPKENPPAPRNDADPATDPYKAYKRKEGTFKTTILSNISFELPDYYEVIDLLGSGAYGHVFAAQDTRIPAPGNAVAIKKVEKAFDNRTFAKRTLREIKILRLMDHENIIKIKEVILPKSRAELNDLYIVYELMETDLGQVIRSGQPLSADHIKFFVYQILRSLKYLHSCKIVHRDLKPRNLLVNSNCDLKLCDFGFARPLNILGCVTEMTDYVVTRWYRAPELLMSHSQYSFGVDMWSVGCIMAELILKKPLLRGTTTKEQINLVFDLIGTPSEEEIGKIEKEQFRTYVKELQRVPGKDFSKVFKNVEADAIDFMKKVLKFTPSARLSVEEALEHEYFSDLHAPEDEPSGKPVDQAEFEFELYNLNKEQLKDLIFEEILLYHFEDFRKLYSTRKAKGESLTLHVIRNKHADTSKDSEDEEEEEKA